MKKKIIAPNGKQFEFEIVGYSYFEKLSKEHNGKIYLKYNELYDECLDTTVYQLNDERILMEVAGTILLFDQEENYLAYLYSSGVLNAQKTIQNIYPILRINYLKDNRKVIYYEISPIEGKALKIISTEIELAETSIYRFFELTDGELLVTKVNNDSYFIYNSKEDYQAIQEKERLCSELGKGLIDKDRLVSDMMCGRNVYGKDFLEEITQLVDQLPDLLRAPSSIFDFQKSSLPKIDKYLHRHHITDDFTDRLLLPLLAYLGETYIQSEEGKWVMRYDEIFMTWVPDIYTKDGFKQMYLPLLKILSPEYSMWNPLMMVYNYKI